MKEVSQTLAAELFIGASEENEFMPGIINNLRGHRYHSTTSTVTHEEVVSQRPEYQVSLLRCKVRIFED